MTKILMESTKETAEMAAEPTLLTIMVSIVPIREDRSCSTMIGIKSFLKSLLVKRCWEPDFTGGLLSHADFMLMN